MIPHPSALVFVPCIGSEGTWLYPNCGGQGGDWYVGEPVPGECVTNALPVNDGMSVLWAPDLQHIWEALLGLLEGGGVPMVELPMEEKDKEERRQRPSVAGKTAPL